MAASTVTSSTGVVSGTDPNFAVTYKTNTSQGLVLYVDYTKGTETGISITFDVMNPSLGTSLFRQVSISGTTLSAYAMTITATGRYRIPTPVIVGEKTIVANVVFGSSNQGGAAIINFMES